MTYQEACIHAHNAEVAAILVEVESMNAENLARERRGDSLAYGGEAYQKKAEELRNLAVWIRDLAAYL